MLSKQETSDDDDDSRVNDEDPDEKVKLGCNADPSKFKSVIDMDKPTELHSEMNDKIYGTMTYEVKYSKVIDNKRNIPDRFKLIETEANEDDVYEASTAHLAPKFECANKADGLRFALLKEIEVIRQYLLSKGNRNPMKAIPVTNIENFMELFNLQYDHFKMMTRADITDLILRK